MADQVICVRPPNHQQQKVIPWQNVMSTTKYELQEWYINIHVRYVVPCSQYTSKHCSDAIMGAMVSQITSLTSVYSTVYSDADQRKHQSSASLAFVRGIHRGPLNSPYKWPVRRKMFPFDDVIMKNRDWSLQMSTSWQVFLDSLCLVIFTLNSFVQNVDKVFYASRSVCWAATSS